MRGTVPRRHKLPDGAEMGRGHSPHKPINKDTESGAAHTGPDNPARECVAVYFSPNVIEDVGNQENQHCATNGQRAQRDEFGSNRWHQHQNSNVVAGEQIQQLRVLATGMHFILHKRPHECPLKGLSLGRQECLLHAVDKPNRRTPNASRIPEYC